jgi:uncharacterized protein YprB with RNaseH-like and TPR domain
MDFPKILFWDIETAGVQALKSDLGFVILLGFKWSFEDKVHVLSIDEKSLKSFDDSKLLKEASKLFEEADLTVTHFGSVFDRRFVQGRLLINGLPPIPPTKMRDTCMISRSAANFSSNRLKYLAKILKLRNQKLDNDWPSAWFKVMQGDMAALRGLAKYCKGDVLALEELYYRLLPFDAAHPRIIMDRTKCPVCAGAVEYRGYSLVANKRYRRFVCLKCRRWSRESKAEK